MNPRDKQSLGSWLMEFPRRFIKLIKRPVIFLVLLIVGMVSGIWIFVGTFMLFTLGLDLRGILFLTLSYFVAIIYAWLMDTNRMHYLIHGKDDE
jgi:hypothetical protein